MTVLPWRRSLRCALGLSALFLSSALPAQSAASPCEPWIARLISYQGTLLFRRASGVQQASVSRNEIFCVGDVLEIGSFSRAALQLPDQTVVRLDQGTVVTFAAPKDEKRNWLEILKGVIHIISRDPRALRIITPFANAGIEGTEFLVRVGVDTALVLVYEGSVLVENPLGSATAGSGESVLAQAGRAPVLQQVVRPRDQVVWTLYYPPLSSASTVGAASAATTLSLADLLARAEQRLAVGRIAEAETDLAAALKLEPGSAEVLARQSVIALTRNDAATARELADRAVTSAPGSASARLAQSYARQSAADLPGAVATLEAAAADHPNDALVRARLAELYLASGDVDRSEASAKAAVAADPKLGLAQTILGFAKLTRVQLGAARSAFDEAIRLEPAAPLPRLGLGLAKIRDGDLEAGREEIETAVILDPNNSLVRSYMGKAYYEEKRDKLAASQLAIAKELDPNDPTPWFYDAIRKQTVNRPVEGLSDLQKSIARNGNRAVYRSRLELDQDLAARSASQGRIYGDLGFEELALREGWQSVATDPSDYSGHRLLADSYATLPRHEIARVNELLQSQLLQPLNMTPVQPQLGEANLFILDSAGPSAVAFNEFNPLFNRNGLSIQGSGAGGGNSTWGEDLVLAGIHDQWSFSLGQFHFETEGFRENNDLKQDLFTGFVQYQASPDTSIVAEARVTDREQGDLTLLFDPTYFLADLRQSENPQSFRLGMRHNLTPSSSVLALVAYQGGELSTDLGTAFASDIDFEGYSAELQYLFRDSDWSLTAGIRYARRHSDDVQVFQFDIPDPPFVVSGTDFISTRNDVLNAYAYGQIALSDDLILTLGGSADSLNSNSIDVDQLSPKAGLLWRVTPNTVLRMAAFRTIQPPTYSRQDIQPSLEPTPVSSFNQFFAGTEGEEAWRYGIGLDHRFSERVSAGIELSKRDLETPYLEAVAPPDFGFNLRQADVEELSARAYAYFAPTDRVALSAEYEYGKQSNDEDNVPRGFFTLETNMVPLSVRYILPSGFGAGLTSTYVHQRGQFFRTDLFFLPPTRESDTFFVFDAFASYRLPRRLGVISLEARNLIGEEIKFQDLDPENPRIYPERVVLARLTIALAP